VPSGNWSSFIAASHQILTTTIVLALAAADPGYLESPRSVDAAGDPRLALTCAMVASKKDQESRR